MGVVHASFSCLSDQYLERRAPLAGSLLPWLQRDRPPVLCSSLGVPSGSRGFGETVLLFSARLSGSPQAPALRPFSAWRCGRPHCFPPRFVGAPGHPPFSPARCGSSMALWSPSFSSELQIDETHPAHQSHSPRPCLTQVCALPLPVSTAGAIRLAAHSGSLAGVGPPQAPPAP